MFCRLLMVLVRRFCTAPRSARALPMSARAPSIAPIAAEKLVSAMALSLPAMVMALVIPRSLARNLPLRSILIWFSPPVLEPTWKVITLAEPSSKFLPFS
ncbi:hypothetical protein D3C80_1429570 [compost metagenome]